MCELGVKYSIIDDAIDQWCRHLHDYIQATIGHCQYSPDISYAKHY